MAMIIPVRAYREFLKTEEGLILRIVGEEIHVTGRLVGKTVQPVSGEDHRLEGPAILQFVDQNYERSGPYTLLRTPRELEFYEDPNNFESHFILDELDISCVLRRICQALEKKCDEAIKKAKVRDEKEMFRVQGEFEEKLGGLKFESVFLKCLGLTFRGVEAEEIKGGCEQDLKYDTGEGTYKCRGKAAPGMKYCKLCTWVHEAEEELGKVLESE